MGIAWSAFGESHLSGYKVNRPDVVCEVFEDEVVVVNLASGTYYSLGATAVEVWNLIDQGSGPDSVIHNLATRHARAPEDIRPDIDRFLAQLLEEHLIVVDGSSPNAAVQHEKAPTPERASAGYVAPSLEKYTDMQELLLLDPIHEVDETGWPARPPQAPTN